MRSLVVVALLAVLGCEGGGGDAPAAPEANELGSGSRVADLVSAATWEDRSDPSSLACAYPGSLDARVTGMTLEWIDDFDEVGDGSGVGNHYVRDTSDDPAPYSAITLYRPTFSPPDLRLAPGDVVDFAGTKEEFAGPSSFVFDDCRTLPELGGTVAFRFDGQGDVAPKTIAAEELFDYATARPWLGMLVRVENVTLLAAKPSGGRLSARFLGAADDAVDVPAVFNELYDVAAHGPDLGGGEQTFASVTGILTYFGGFHLAPRSPEDFVTP